MKRRIVICNDGTWNSTESEDRGSIKPTNITKISRAVNPVAEDGTTQITFYDEGVGTSWGQKVIGGITGLGLSANLLDSYRFLANNYQEGDEIYIFGFSRGAYTSRSLCGLISLIGLVTKDDVFYLPELYRLYREDASAEEVDAFYTDKEIARSSPKIKMIGVFDTVGALGVPISKINDWLNDRELAEFQFHNVELSPIVEHAYHALAIDEKRKPFAASLWSSAPAEMIEMEQRWFVGVHSNIGGGYHPDGLANIPLKYMVEKAAACGLSWNHDYLNFYAGKSTDEIRDSMSLKYKILGENLREISPGGKTCEVVDDTVYERIESTPDYNPKNVPLLE